MLMSCFLHVSNGYRMVTCQAAYTVLMYCTSALLQKTLSRYVCSIPIVLELKLLAKLKNTLQESCYGNHIARVMLLE